VPDSRFSDHAIKVDTLENSIPVLDRNADRRISGAMSVLTPDRQNEKKEIIERSQKFVVPYRVISGKNFRLKDVDPNDTGEATSEDKPWAKELLEKGVEVLAELQDVLYAQDQWSILLIFQAMTLPGKMVRSSTSCPASTRRDAKSFHSKARRRNISNTTISGVA
jgi:hypothetical protein